MLSALVTSVMEPGASPQIVRIINYALVGLIITAFSILFMGYGNIHVYVMMFLAVGLGLSINWFVIEMENQKKLNEAGDSLGDGAAGRKKHD
mmetsp:Transcript_12182/g.24182  ORF Transcript_12182/g.24182 Transcript_12182/m.24182 type:complete len:92 (+) Transcript_12182:38-313(+)